MNTLIRKSLFLVLSVLTSFATVTVAADSTNGLRSISLSYCQNFTSTLFGLRAGYEHPFFSTEKFSLYGGVAIAAHHKPNIYTTAEISISNTVRKTFPFGLLIEHGIRIGYLGSYYHFDLYELDDDYNIVNVGREWKSSVIGGYFIGTGYDFSKKTPLNLLLFFRTSLYLKIPNNDSYALFHNNGIEAGITLYPKWFQ